MRVQSPLMRGATLYLYSVGVLLVWLSCAGLAAVSALGIAWEITRRQLVAPGLAYAGAGLAISLLIAWAYPRWVGGRYRRWTGRSAWFARGRRPSDRD